MNSCALIRRRVYMNTCLFFSSLSLIAPFPANTKKLCALRLWNSALMLLGSFKSFYKGTQLTRKVYSSKNPRAWPSKCLSVYMFVCPFAFFKFCVSSVVQNVLQDTRNFLRRNYTRWFGPLATALAKDGFFKVVIKNKFWDWPILVVASLFLSLVCIVKVAGIYNINTKTINIPRKSKKINKRKWIIIVIIII